MGADWPSQDEIKKLIRSVDDLPREYDKRTDLESATLNLAMHSRDKLIDFLKNLDIRVKEDRNALFDLMDSIPENHLYHVKGKMESLERMASLISAGVINWEDIKRLTQQNQGYPSFPDPTRISDRHYVFTSKELAYFREKAGKFGSTTDPILFAAYARDELPQCLLREFIKTDETFSQQIKTYSSGEMTFFYSGVQIPFSILARWLAEDWNKWTQKDLTNPQTGFVYLLESCPIILCEDL